MRACDVRPVISLAARASPITGITCCHCRVRRHPPPVVHRGGGGSRLGEPASARHPRRSCRCRPSISSTDPCTRPHRPEKIKQLMMSMGSPASLERKTRRADDERIGSDRTTTPRPQPHACAVFRSGVPCARTRLSSIDQECSTRPRVGRASE